MKNKIVFLGIILQIFFCTSCKEIEEENSNVSEISSERRSGFIHTSGSKIVDANNNPILLRGASFSNDVWSKPDLHDTHHAEIDYARIKQMNMNVVRFYLNYATFENDASPYVYKQSGWDWLNQNILWAKRNGVYLILNMHIPQGGFQSNGNGDALWNSVENQNRLVALWKTIAQKYRNEQQIVGFGLVNEPLPTNKDIWKQVAQRITDSIRTVDKNHIVFIEKPTSIRGENRENADFNFPEISDNNKVYEFHNYDPYQYTHQLLDYTTLPDGGKYPDENLINFENESWYSGIFTNPTVPSGNSDWTKYEGVKFKIEDPNMKIGVPVLVGGGVGGKIYFDDIIIKEYNPSGEFVRDVLSKNLNSSYQWGYWSSNNTGTFGESSSTGVNDSKSLYIEANTLDCNLSNYSMAFIPKQGFYYQISGYMKGENVANNSFCSVRIDFLKTDNPVFGRNKQFLEYTINKYSNWGNAKNVPVYLGEFGAGKFCFENNRGGLQYLTDVIDITKNNNISFTYHNYHGDDFSLYYNSNALPNPGNVNQPLIDLFTQKLK